MAQASKTPGTAAPLAELREETLKHLDAIKGELDEAEKDLDALDKIGIDTSRLREKVEWGRRARDIILERYGKRS